MTRPQPPTVVRRVAIAFAAALAVVFVAGFVSLAVWPPINDVATGATPEYPDIQPRSYRFSQGRVAAAAQETLETLDGLTLVSLAETHPDDAPEDAPQTTITATARSRSGLFTDDVTLRIEANGDGGAIVFIRSQSRVGKGDFGQNARTIRRIQAAMDANLGGP